MSAPVTSALLRRAVAAERRQRGSNLAGPGLPSTLPGASVTTDYKARREAERVRPSAEQVLAAAQGVVGRPRLAATLLGFRCEPPTIQLPKVAPTTWSHVVDPTAFHAAPAPFDAGVVAPPRERASTSPAAREHAGRPSRGRVLPIETGRRSGVTRSTRGECWRRSRLPRATNRVALFWHPETGRSPCRSAPGPVQGSRVALATTRRRRGLSLRPPERTLATARGLGGW